MSQTPGLHGPAVTDSNRCTAAINTVAWTESNYRDNDFQSSAKRFYRKEFGFVPRALERQDKKKLLTNLT